MILEEEGEVLADLAETKERLQKAQARVPHLLEETSFKLVVDTTKARLNFLRGLRKTAYSLEERSNPYR